MGNLTIPDTLKLALKKHGLFPEFPRPPSMKHIIIKQINFSILRFNKLQKNLAGKHEMHGMAMTNYQLQMWRRKSLAQIPIQPLGPDPNTSLRAYGDINTTCIYKYKLPKHIT